MIRGAAAVCTGPAEVTGAPGGRSAWRYRAGRRAPVPTARARGRRGGSIVPARRNSQPACPQAMAVMRNTSASSGGIRSSGRTSTTTPPPSARRAKKSGACRRDRPSSSWTIGDRTIQNYLAGPRSRATSLVRPGWTGHRGRDPASGRRAAGSPDFTSAAREFASQTGPGPKSDHGLHRNRTHRPAPPLSRESALGAPARQARAERAPARAAR